MNFFFWGGGGGGGGGEVMFGPLLGLRLKLGIVLGVGYTQI